MLSAWAQPPGARTSARQKMCPTWLPSKRREPLRWRCKNEYRTNHIILNIVFMVLFIWDRGADISGGEEGKK